MSNPMFNEKRMNRDAAGWAAPVAPAGVGTATRPISDGPIGPWSAATMTVNGTLTATTALFVLFLVSATFGWIASVGPAANGDGEQYQFPGLALAGLAVGFVAVIVFNFKPMWAKVLGPIYSLGYGFAVGAFSHGFETLYDGIVLQAAGATLAVVLSMLLLYRLRIIRVTARFRQIVGVATMGIMVLYVGSFLIQMLGGDVAFLRSASPLGILFSVFVCGLAAARLAVQYDLIERGARDGFPKAYEWAAGFGLMVTIVWLYVEILILLSKLNRR